MKTPRPGCLLVAKPMLSDPHFMRSVVFLLEYNEGGALGLVINRPLQLPLGELWEECPEQLGTMRLCGEGGPVDRDKGLLLHRNLTLTGAFDLGCGLAVGGDPLALGQRFSAGPNESGPRLYLGHAAWAPEQLESEIQEGSWLVRRGNPALVIEAEPAEDVWQELIAAGPETQGPSLN